MSRRSEDEPPPTPKNTNPSELGFRRRQRMVRWLSPGLLAQTAVRVGLSSVFGSYADKREIEAVLPAASLPSYASNADLWIDYVADVGDSFGTTYSVARLLACAELELRKPDGESTLTPRGRLLVLGGDQVYPTASIDNYNDRTLGPYRAALPFTRDDHPDMYAIPGNHDWYDGLTSFLRIFCRNQWVGGWRTQQSRSYFALELGRRWWMWGIDIQLDTYIDEPQLDYFRTASGRLRRGDAVILCSAVPSWVKANDGEPEAYARLDYFERTLIRPRGASVRLSLTGDTHHYARYEAADGSHKITAGGGGAYLSATHHLPDPLALPPEASRDPGKTSPPARYDLRSIFPDKRASRRYRWSVAALPFRNADFLALVGVVHLIYLWSVQAAAPDEQETFARLMRDLSMRELNFALLRSPLAWIVTVLVIAGLVGFTQSSGWKRGLGVIHAAAHIAAVWSSIWFAGRSLDVVSSTGWYTGLYVALVFIGGGLVGSWAMAVYLALADHLKVNDNELFAAQRLRHYKCFLRLRLDTRGVLTIYPVGLRRTVRSWALDTEAGPGESWFTPKGELQPELIEEPIRIRAR